MYIFMVLYSFALVTVFYKWSIHLNRSFTMIALGSYRQGRQHRTASRRWLGVMVVMVVVPIIAQIREYAA